MSINLASRSYHLAHITFYLAPTSIGPSCIEHGKLFLLLVLANDTIFFLLPFLLVLTSDIIPFLLLLSFSLVSIIKVFILQCSQHLIPLRPISYFNTLQVYSIRDAAANNLKRLAEEFGPEWAMQHIIPQVYFHYSIECKISCQLPFVSCFFCTW